MDGSDALRLPRSLVGNIDAYGPPGRNRCIGWLEAMEIMLQGYWKCHTRTAIVQRARDASTSVRTCKNGRPNGLGRGEDQRG